jgi:signal transduction histidine kinase/ActR/RegA family two-component response regulator
MDKARRRQPPHEVNMNNAIRESVELKTGAPERRGADAALRWNEERYRTLFDLGPVAVYSCDASGVIQEFNRRAVELWGCEPALGDTDKRFCGSFKLFRPDGRFMPHEQCPMAEVIAGTLAEACDAEVLIERPDGSRITVVVNIRPLKNERGDILGAINCFYDITARKEMEDSLRDSDRRKSEFLAMLAHELRNPLAPIRHSLEVMRRARKVESAATGSQGTGRTKPALSQPIDAAMDVLDRQVGQMVRLVDDLLDLGRISRGKIVLRKERVELSSVVHHAVEAARPLCEISDQELTVTLPQEPVYLNADPTRLAQIVGNLLNNACKFSDRGGRIWLTVERTQESAGDTVITSRGLPPNVVIRVRDTGIGIPANQHSRIFDMFTQGDTALEREVTGLGIGLTLVKTLTQMHGGTVDVSSAGIGQGSEFIVRLPIMVEPATVPSPALTREPALTAKGLRILIVDDNRDAAGMLAMLLQFSGHETHMAHDGVEAVEVTTKLQPDVILLDIGLPRLNGYEAARKIREHQEQPGRPLLVALTGWGQDEDRRRSEEAGFDAHLIKPVDEAALGKLLDDFGAGKQEVGSVPALQHTSE